MRNQILILLFFGILACKEIKPKENLVTEIEQTEKTDNLLKTELHKLLTESYQKKSVDSLNIFFEKWKAESNGIEPIINDSLTSNLYQIFYKIYHPFELEKYGWTKREHLKKYRYVITHSNLPYVYGTKVDTLKNFRPKNKFSNASVLNSISIFDDVMIDFLIADKQDKEWFLREVLLMPITYKEINFRTSPEINNIIINQELNKASAEIRLISTGLDLKLKKVDNEWSIIEVNQLSIE